MTKHENKVIWIIENYFFFCFLTKCESSHCDWAILGTYSWLTVNNFELNDFF